MEVVGEEQHHPVAPEGLAEPLDGMGRGAPVAAEQGGGDLRLRPAGEHGAAVELGGVDHRRGAGGGAAGGGQRWPALGEGPGGGAQRRGTLRRRQVTRRRGLGPGDPGDPEARLALLAGELGGAHRAAKLAVSARAAGDQPQPGAVGEVELGPDDGVEAGPAGGMGEGDGAVEAVAVADPERSQPRDGGGLDEGAGGGGALQEGVVGAGGELGEAR